MIDYQIKEENKVKRALENKRMLAGQLFKANMGLDSAKNVLMARYQEDERLKVQRETNIPPDDLFIGLGWDETPTSNTRHYRRFYPQELENTIEIMPTPSPFDTHDLLRGQTRGSS